MGRRSRGALSLSFSVSLVTAGARFLPLSLSLTLEGSRGRLEGWRSKLIRAGKRAPLTNEPTRERRKSQPGKSSADRRPTFYSQSSGTTILRLGLQSYTFFDRFSRIFLPSSSFFLVFDSSPARPRPGTQAGSPCSSLALSARKTGRHLSCAALAHCDIDSSPRRRSVPSCTLRKDDTLCSCLAALCARGDFSRSDKIV